MKSSGSPNDSSPRRTLQRCLAWSLAALLPAAFGACATTGVNRGDLNLVSLDEEWQLGRRLEGDLASQLDLVHDTAVVGYVDHLGRAVVAETELGNLPWEFLVVADPAINAFNIPGGHVYVNTGLITAAGDVSEFTSVVSHEIAHGASRHGTEQLTRRLRLQLLGRLVLGAACTEVSGPSGAGPPPRSRGSTGSGRVR